MPPKRRSGKRLDALKSAPETIEQGEADQSQGEAPFQAPASEQDTTRTFALSIANSLFATAKDTLAESTALARPSSASSSKGSGPTTLHEDSASSVTRFYLSPTATRMFRHVPNVPSPEASSTTSSHPLTLSASSSPLQIGGTDSVGFIGLLGIPMLDKTILDECVQGFFDTIGLCLAFVRPEEFWPRYHAFYALYSGQPLPESLRDVQPLTESLLLAVAARGVTATHYANRFQLQEFIARRVEGLLRDGDRLLSEGMDGLEALFLYTENRFGPDVMQPASQGSDVFHIDPISQEGVVRLMLRMQLNRIRPFGRTLNEVERIRKYLIFWSIWIFDTFRSVSSRTMPLVNDEDIELTEIVEIQNPRIQWRNSLVRLGKLHKRIYRVAGSGRVRTTGIEPHDIHELLDEFAAYYDQLEDFLKWDWDDFLHMTGPSDLAERARRAITVMGWLGLYITLWTSVRDYGCISAPGQDEAKQRLEQETDMMLMRQATVADYCTVYNVMRVHPNLLRSLTAGWCFWAIQQIQATASTSPLTTQRFHAAQTLINAIMVVDTVKDTASLAANLQDALNAAKRQCEEMGLNLL